MLPEIQSAKLVKCLAAFDDPNWIFELKHDGFRSLAYVEHGHCRLVSRRRNTYKSFEVLREALSGLRAQSAILDGVDLRQTPLVERKKKLKKLIDRSDCSEILYAQHIEGSGKLLFEEVRERNLEGMVAKRRMGVYAEHGWLD